MRARGLLVAALFFAGAAVLATWPLAAHLSIGSLDLWDAKLNAWILNWDFHQTFLGPFHLFDANIFFPATLALAFSENLFGAAVFGFPLYAAGISTLVVYNALFLLGMFLSAVAAWALAREVTGDAAASLLAGLVYAFLPWRIDQVAHFQFQWGAFLPLSLLFLIRYFDAGRRRDLALFAVCLMWNALCNVHYAVFSGALLAVALGFELLTGQEGSRRRVLRALLASGLVGAAVSAFLHPYAEARRLYGMERYAAEMEFFSGRLTYFLSAGVRNLTYGAMTARFSGPEGAFFPGLVPVALSILAIARLARRHEPQSAAARSRTATGWLRALDGTFFALLLLYLVAKLRPGLQIGFIGLRDPGRLIVFASVVVIARLCIAFPRRFRFRDLGAFARGAFADRRVVLLLTLGLAGVLIALGAHAPYYRFLFDTFGFLFRAIRSPARGIVLFDVALAVLSAWGLSLLAGRRPGARRTGVLAAALVLTGIEYRAFPIEVMPVEAAAPPVYHWLARTRFPGAVMEWPLGDVYDFEYEFRSTAHWRPIVNGSSGFTPPAYRELRDLLGRAPITDAVWERAAGVGASLLVLHPHDASRAVLFSNLAAVRRAVETGKLDLLTTFPHGVDTDYVFRITSAPDFDAGVTSEERAEAARRFANIAVRPGTDPLPPLANLDFPPADFELDGTGWAYGWALDDSGILEVRVATELGPVGPALYGGPRPDVGRIFTAYPDASSCAFGFPLPPLPPGRHTFIVTVLAKDGGRTVLRRPVRYR